MKTERIIPELKKGLHFKDHSFNWTIKKVFKDYIILDGSRWVTPEKLTARFKSGGAVILD